VSEHGWQCKFEDPISVSDGRMLVTLRDARRLHHRPAEKGIRPAGMASGDRVLMLVVELGGPTMFARIGIMRGLNRGHVREFNPSGKTALLGLRKLKRDQ